jgi:hypothetical protein
VASPLITARRSLWSSTCACMCTAGAAPAATGWHCKHAHIHTQREIHVVQRYAASHTYQA